MASFSKSRAILGRGQPLVLQWQSQHFIGVDWADHIIGEKENVFTVKLFPYKVIEESKKS